MTLAIFGVHGKNRAAPRRLMAGVLAALTIAAATPAANAQQAETLGVFEAWSAFKATEGGNPVCYIGAEPEKAEGDYSKRGDTYMLVTQRPTEGAFDVVSVNAGYTYKEGSDVNVRIGGETFELFTDGGHAWARSPEADKALVGAMKRGLDMVIKGTSWRGTLTTDTYSLKGFTAAYNASRKACGL